MTEIDPRYEDTTNRDKAIKEWAEREGINEDDIAYYWESDSHYMLGIEFRDGTTRAVMFRDLFPGSVKEKKS